MPETYTVRRSELKTSVVCGVFFASLTVFCAVALPLDGESFSFTAAMSAFWGAWTLLSVYHIAASRRARLVLSPREIVQQGAIDEVSMTMDEIQRLQWRYVNRSVKLHSEAKRLTIHLNSFEPHEQLSIVRFLRAYVPENVQHDWPSFCHVTAMRLLEGEPDPDKDPRYVRLTRQRWDRLFAVAIGAIAIVLVPTAWWLSNPVMLIAPFAILPLWLIFRFSTPAIGNASMRMSAEKGGRFLCFAGVWFLVAGLGLYLTWPSAPALAIDEIPWRVWLFLFAWFAVFLWQVHVGEKWQRRNLLEGSQESVERWNQLGDKAPAANS